MRTIGPLCLVYMALALDSPLWAILIMYMLRWALMNSTVGLSRSLMMDVVPASERARWNAVESLMGASWSGSALLGGFVADKTDYRTSFLITLGFFALSVLMLATAAMTPEYRGENNKSGGNIEINDNDNEDASGDNKNARKAIEKQIATSRMRFWPASPRPVRPGGASRHR